jgi:hypothetical protein
VYPPHPVSILYQSTVKQLINPTAERKRREPEDSIVRFQIDGMI